ncbi:MAG: response regulator [Calditrichaeota bacterium]|nr:response regulator [Calditrichota bacterium]
MKREQSLTTPLWVFSGLSLILVAGLVSFSLFLARDQMTRDFRKDCSQQISGITRDIGAGLWLRQLDYAGTILNQFAGDSLNVAFLRLISADDKRLLGIRDDVHAALIQRFNSGDHRIRPGDPDLILVRQPIHYNAELQGFLLAGFERAPLNQRIANREKLVFFGVGAFAVLQFLLTVLFARWLNTPLRRFGRYLNESMEKSGGLKALEAIDKGPRLPEVSKAIEQLLGSVREHYQEVEEKRDQLDHFLRQSPVPLLITDTIGQIKRVNQSACGFFENDAEHLIGNRLEHLIGSADYYNIKNTLDANRENLTGYLTVILTPRANRKIAELSLSMIKDPQGDPLYYVISLIDVTDKIEVQQEILSNQDRFALFSQEIQQNRDALVESVERERRLARQQSGFIQALKESGSATSVAQVLNLLVKAGRQLSGAQEAIVFLGGGEHAQLEPLKFEPVKSFKTPHPMEDGEGVIRDVFRQKAPRANTALHPADAAALNLADGSPRLITAIPLILNNITLGVAVFLQPENQEFAPNEVNLLNGLCLMAALQLQKQRLVQAYQEKLENIEEGKSAPAGALAPVPHPEKMESLSNLVGGIAHNFNNILGIISPNLDLLRMNIDDPVVVGNRLNILQKATRRATEITRQLLLLAHSDDIDTKAVSPNLLVRTLQEILEKAMDRNITIETHLDENIPDIQVNEKLFGQALANLAANAREAMPDGGTLTFTTETVIPANGNGKAPSPVVRISVRDTGAGIPPEDLTQVFDPFFSASTRHQGIGLGLPVAYGIVRNHGGRMEAHSEPGKGSLFTIDLLPAAAEPAAAPAKPAAPPKTARPGNTTSNLVLVIDDEAMLRESLSDLLRYLGYEVLLAEGGKEALEHIRKNSDIRLAIVDYAMPVMDGLATIKGIQNLNRSIKIVLSSGYANRQKLAEESPAIQAFLPKPYHIENLEEILNSVLNAGEPA